MAKRKDPLKIDRARDAWVTPGHDLVRFQALTSKGEHIDVLMHKATARALGMALSTAGK